MLAGIHGITAVQVRRDLMLIGFSSDTKKGYDVKVLIDFISNILDSESPVNIAVIGMGHLGQAITKYFNGKSLKRGSRSRSTSIPQKWILRSTTFRATTWSVSRRSSGERHLDRHRIFADQSRPELVVPIINAGIKGVLNFTSTRLNFPQGIYVENYDITTLLEKVAYCVKESEENNDNN